MVPMSDALRAELEQARADLRAHLASVEYAYAMGASRNGGGEHPVHWAVRARADELAQRVNHLAARLAEHSVDPDDHAGPTDDEAA
jgi:hypothetical protein